ncbi:MAG: penicillin-binding protein 2 [Actinomycetota bacterium]|nr:penicillin-binding protein 2 [Actinomycetota bacterium]
MNTQLRRTFYLFVAGFVALVGVMAYWQVYAKESLATDPANSLQSQRVQGVPRGLILANDGETVLARSEEQDNGTYGRVYPEGSVYSNVIGYWSPKYGASGVEIGQNNYLSGGGEPETLDGLINQVTGGPQAGNDVTLTLDPELQRLAYDQLAQSSTGRGSVVALNPKKGEILAMVSYPSYDPNNIDENFPELVQDSEAPLLNRAMQGLYPPGSVFKVITAAAALKAGVDPEDEFDDTGTYETPGYDVYNYRAREYGEVTFTEALGKSINTIFARIAYEEVGAQLLAQTALDFGFEDPYEDFPLPVAPSSLGELPPEQWVQGYIAQIAFGQGPILSNVFEMANMTGAVANDGTMMEPRLVREVRSPDGVILDKPTPRVRGGVLDAETAQTLNDMMQKSITDEETGAQIPGIKVAGKTGTAEAPGGELHSWFASFAPANDPEIAVAVLVENGQEGFKSALPIARRLMEAYIGPTETQQTTQPTAPETTQPTAPETTQPTQPTQPKTKAPPAQPKNGFPFQNPNQNQKAVPGQQKAPGQGPSQSSGQRQSG